jgi:hypothetical protein
MFTFAANIKLAFGPTNAKSKLSAYEKLSMQVCLKDA